MRSYTPLIIILFLVSCSKDQSTPPPTPSPCDSIADVSFTSDIKPLINNNCNTSLCHGGNAGNVNFENYPIIKEYIENGKIEQRVLVDENMPPTAPLDICDQIMLQQWIDAGAPNN